MPPPLTKTAKRLALTVGDPAGIGPDLCLEVMNGDSPAAITIIGDAEELAHRAHLLGVNFAAEEYHENMAAHRTVWHCPVQSPVVAGQLSSANAAHVLAQLQTAVLGCRRGLFDAMITAPVSKEIICAAGFDFCGQTEYIASLLEVPHPVMLLAGKKMRVALATRHLPLAQVVAAVDEDNLWRTLCVLDDGLRRHCHLAKARIAVAGLNPHAGEGGFLGDEEERVIKPALRRAQQCGIFAEGPFAADTIFARPADCVLAMYHDQGLPVIKYADFANTVNATLGLPFLRVSPDHGTAAEVAGSGRADGASMRAAVAWAAQ